MLNKQRLIKSAKSLLWRVAMFMVVVFLEGLNTRLTGYNLPSEATILLGLTLGEVSKIANKYYQERRWEREY